MQYFNNLRYAMKNYFIDRLLGKDTNATFWYITELPNVYDKKTLSDYLNPKTDAPIYLINYRNKLQYSLKNSAGIIILPYPDPIGRQVNPESAFQYALGLHDEYVHSGDKGYLKQFLFYADYFLARQQGDGNWNYEFDWYESRSPWSSALAQSRGASVMLRAWLCTHDDQYKNAALAAIAQFDRLCDEGGFTNIFPWENCTYYEEYPRSPSYVLNGFIASLFGLWELSHWLNDAKSTSLWKTGIASLKKMYSYYNYHGWTLYDLNPKFGLPNLNSPRYHELMINYTRILSVIVGDTLFNEYCSLWLARNNLVFKTLAMATKSIRKVFYR